jgi:5-methylcytosine-specific restriction endonuclease McrA
LEQAVIPSPDDQLAFLSTLQRLFAEGDFTATYKYALLIAMSDLAVEVGRDDDSSLRLTHQSLARKFVELYWQQTAPYGSGRGKSAVLVQNVGEQAAVVSAIVAFRTRNPSATVQSAPAFLGFREMLLKVTQTVAAQPVKYLQNLGGTTEPFLYRRERGAIVLKPGVVYCLRRFQPLVQQLARSHWIGHVKDNKRNTPMLGHADDLESFLFETPRQALALIGSGLRRLSPRCFYCDIAVGSEADVDHFIPFVMYPRDLSHNFVLAHAKCNRSKSNTLAAHSHLQRWVEYTVKHDDDLKEIGATAGRVVDADTCRSVALWSYTNAAQAGAQAWFKAGSYEKVDQRYLDCLT